MNDNECSIFKINDYDVFLYREWPGSADLKNSFHALVVNSVWPNIFLTWEWTSLWWKWFGDQGGLRMLVLKDSSGVAAIVLLHIHRTRIIPGVYIDTLRFVGDGGPVCPDFLSPILSKSSNENELVEAIAKAILSISGEWSSIRFSDVLLQSPGMQQLVDILSKYCKKELEDGEKAPYLTLPESYDLFLSSLGSRQRESIRRRLRQARKRYNVRLECITDRECADNAISDLMTVFKNSKRGAVTGHAFNKSEYLGFHTDVIKKVAENGWLRLFVLYFDETPVAFLYGYKFEQTFFFYQTGFDLNYRNDGAGSIILQASIEQAIVENCATYEFLRGTEEYKYHFSEGERDAVTILLWPRQGINWFMYKSLKCLVGIVRKIRHGLSANQPTRH